MQRIKWDPVKAEANLRKHGVAFSEAATVLQDQFSIHNFDTGHSDIESRFVAVGTSLAGRVIVVAYTDDGSTIRIISARRATKRERLEYETV